MLGEDGEATVDGIHFVQSLKSNQSKIVSFSA